ncbi:MAG: hypothetical protein EA392_09825 [Cryomorphaceae bacterium]|nr:MAG: hypothetical protein EA392_09825 [Cryomorphaceae bacterium]
MRQENQNPIKCFDMFTPFIHQHHDATWTIHLLTVEIEDIDKLRDFQSDCSAFSSLTHLLNWAGIPFVIGLTNWKCLAYLPSNGGQLFTDINDLLGDYIGVEFTILEVSADAVNSMKGGVQDFWTDNQIVKFKKMIQMIDTHLLNYSRRALSEHELNEILDVIARKGLDNLPCHAYQLLLNHSKFLRQSA